MIPPLRFCMPDDTWSAMSVPTSFTRRTLLVAVTVLAMLGAAACGNDDEPTAGGDAAGGDRVVKIGVVAPIDGGLTDFGRGILNSVELAVAEANEADAIPGWTIEVEAVDDSSDPDTGVDAVQALIDDDDVIGVVGPYNSGVAEAILPSLDEAGLALVSPSNTLASLTLGDGEESVRPHDNYFRLVASDAAQAPFLAQQAYEEGVRSVAVVSETKAVSKNLADDFSAAFTELGGTVGSTAVVADDADDFTAVLEEALAATPDLIFFGGEYDVAATLRSQATEQGYEGDIMGGDGIKSDDYIEAAGDGAEGTWASSVGTPLDQLESAADFVAAYEAGDYEGSPTDYGVFAYDAANAIIRAAAEVLADLQGTPSEVRADLVTALADISFDGASGPVAFDEYGDTTERVFTLYRVDESLEWAVVRTAEA
jgi:branched-chain amino acid transport system substrate-binding protein